MSSGRYILAVYNAAQKEGYICTPPRGAKRPRFITIDARKAQVFFSMVKAQDRAARFNAFNRDLNRRAEVQNAPPKGV